MGDLAIGVTGLLCVRFRNPGFWLAVLLVLAIQYYGDAYGHVYQWIENDNTEQGNVGPPLWVDVIVPTVGLGALRCLPARGESGGACGRSGPGRRGHSGALSVRFAPARPLDEPVDPVTDRPPTSG